MSPLSNPSPQKPASPDAWLEHALNESAGTYLPDDGFTNRVLESLPGQQTSDWRRHLLVFGGAALGTGLAAALGGHSLIRLVVRTGRWLGDWLAQPLADSPYSWGLIFFIGLCGLVSWVAWHRAVR